MRRTVVVRPLVVGAAELRCGTSGGGVLEWLSAGCTGFARPLCQLLKVWTGITDPKVRLRWSSTL